MKIMMLSVVRQTKSPVKFWLLSNFLSPQFKVSSTVRFDDLLSFFCSFYRNLCPRWLRSLALRLSLSLTAGPSGSTHRRRNSASFGGTFSLRSQTCHRPFGNVGCCLSYKILFLDVLFPINVKKIIYVDADQVVRSDLKELWDMDLHVRVHYQLIAFSLSLVPEAFSFPGCCLWLHAILRR